MTTVGIDLGTSRVRAAVVVDRSPQVVQFGDGSHFLPAAVAIDKGAKHVGRGAIARAAMNPQNAILGIKRFLGRLSTDEVVVRIAEQSGTVLTARDDGSLMFKIAKEEYSPEDIAAALISHVAETVEKTTGTAPDAVMLTTPYWFGPKQRQALKEAAQRAGLRVFQVMSDGTAIALSLAVTEIEQRRAGIVDVGAGGCSVSLLEFGPERVVLLSNSGSRDGGGNDIDQDIVRAMLKGLRDKYGDFPVFPAIRELIRQACEDLKRDLLAVETAQATIPFLPIGAGVSMQQMTLERRHFHALMTPTLEKIRAACTEALRAASLAPEGLDAVYVTGGLSQVPVIRESIASVLGQVTSRQLDIDGAVAIGASLQSAMMDGQIDPIPTIDIVTSASIPPPGAAPSSRVTIPPANVRSIRPPSRSSAPPSRESTRPPDIRTPRPTPRPGSRPPSRPPTRPPSSAGFRRPSSSGFQRPSTPFPGSPSRPPSGAFAVPPLDDVQISFREQEPEVPVETLRVELATLLASVRGGALTEGAAAPKRAIGRSSPEAVVEDDAPPEAKEEIAEKLNQFCQQFHRAMQAVRQYSWEHPHTAGYFDRSLNLLEDIQSTWPHSARFDMGTTSFSYEKVVVWRPDRPPFDTVPYQLFVDGLRILQLKPGIDTSELREFAAVLLRDVGGVLVSDDDAVTALWDRRLPHVGYIAIDAYLDTDDPDFEKDLDELEKEIGDLCDFDDVDGISARLDEQRDDADEAVALTLEKEVREKLCRGVELEDEAWLSAYARVFPKVLEESMRERDESVLMSGLDAFAGDVVSSGHSLVAFTVYDRLVESVQGAFGEERAEHFEMQACGAMFTEPRLRRILQDFARVAPSAEATKGLSGVLAMLPDDRFFEGGTEGFWEVSEEVQHFLLEYQLRFAHGREGTFEPMVTRGAPDLAIATLRGLSTLGTEEARAVLIKAFDNPHLEVKVSAIAFLPDAAAETVRSEVARLLEDPSAEVRLSTLGVLSRLGSTAVGPVLVRRIQSADLSTIAHQERKLLLDTLVKLSPRRGSEIAIEILDTTQMIPTQGPEETRAIAAEVLAGVDSEAVIQALERAARKKWSNSTPVREAAQQALDTLRARRASRSEARK